jgi:hypothetical protein
VELSSIGGSSQANYSRLTVTTDLGIQILATWLPGRTPEWIMIGLPV